MMMNRTLVPAFKKVFFAAATAFSFIQCSEEEGLVTSPTQTAVEQSVSARTEARPSVTSLTISGVNTTFATAKDCATCTYIVPSGTSIVDGKALGLGAGSVICLNSLFEYGALELTNIEGTEERPIVITTVGENLSEQSIEESSSSDPY
jgi:hypothetical protein